MVTPELTLRVVVSTIPKSGLLFPGVLTMKLVPDDDVVPVLTGFGLRVTPSGKKVFLVRAKVAGRLVKTTIGTFPQMGVAEARRVARAALDAIRAGKDPAAENAARQRAREQGEVTIAALADRWFEEIVRPKRKPRTAADYEKLFAQHIAPALGDLAVKAITFDDVNRFHLSMARTPRRANYAVSTLRALLTFAEKVQLRAPLSNPCRGVEFFREGKRERFLSEPEIAAAADAIAQAERSGKIGPHAAAGLRLCLFTGARSGEIMAAKWEHLNAARRVIRLPDSKTNEPRTIHLSEAALSVLKTLPRVGPYIVAGNKPGEPFKNLSRSWIVARQYAGLGDVRLHDLRHSYASLAAGRGVSLHMIGRLLGHKVAATTQRYAHLARDAVEAINDELGEAMVAAIEKGQPESAKVLKLRRKGRGRAHV